MVTTEQIKELREKTGISIAECKQALAAAAGDAVKALEALKARGAEIAAKKGNRALAAGAIAAYVHGDALGVLVEVQAETDFVAKNAEFRALADDLAMQVAAMDPADIPTLLAQSFIKNPEMTVADLLQNTIQKFGERIEIVRFARFVAGVH